jgi:DNA-binding transcriptional LysR family regulator
MQQFSLDDLRALVAVGQDRSFTKAAAKLGVSQSALSQTIRQLEARLGVRLLTRTTRSVSPTEVGERPDMRMAGVGAPSYFKKRREPKKPQDLIGHNCINLRLPTHGGLYAWEFEKGDRELRVRVEGQLTFNGTNQMLNAALAGFGLAYVPEGLALSHIAKGRLKRALVDWCAPFSGYHLYYPSRRQSSAAFALLVETLRYRS